MPISRCRTVCVCVYVCSRPGASLADCELCLVLVLLAASSHYMYVCVSVLSVTPFCLCQPTAHPLCSRASVPE